MNKGFVQCTYDICNKTAFTLQLASNRLTGPAWRTESAPQGAENQNYEEGGPGQVKIGPEVYMGLEDFRTAYIRCRVSWDSHHIEGVNIFDVSEKVDMDIMYYI